MSLPSDAMKQALDPSSSAQALVPLSKHWDYSVRAVVVAHPNVTYEVLEDLASDGVGTVRAAVIERAKIWPENDEALLLTATAQGTGDSERDYRAEPIIAEEVLEVVDEPNPNEEKEDGKEM